MFSPGDVVKCIDFGARGPIIWLGKRCTDNVNILRLSPDGAYTIDCCHMSDDGTPVVGICGIDTCGFLAERFRKVEKKRTREELYSLIGITLEEKGGARVPAIAGGLPYPEPSLLPMCRCASPVLTASLRRKGR